MRFLAFISFFMLSDYASFTQDFFIKGHITNEHKQPLSGTTVILRKVDSGQVMRYILTKSDGSFKINLDKLLAGQYLLELRHISYINVQKLINNSPDVKSDSVIHITMYPRNVELKEVVIKREPPVVIRSDTIEFNAGSFRNIETRKLEDLLKNINGFSVDANGKISFNGKVVDKVLIEGDDLADKGYRMITRNLNAGLIDKVQVIDNYQDNRLMRQVTQSDKIGINLKMVPGIRNRLNGGITTGLSVEKRFLAEGSLVYVGKPFKMLSFFNANNIAEDPSGNVRYYYSKEGSAEEYQSKGGSKYNILSGAAIIPPEISDRYKQDNHDAAASVMGSWSLGDHVKMKMIIGADRLNLYRSAYAENNTYINDTDNWATKNNMKENFTADDKLVSFSFHRDALINHITHIDLDLGMGSQENGYRNLSSGSLVDTLTESLKDHDKFFYFKWEESLLLPGKKVFSSSLILHRENLHQELINESSRFTGLFGIDSSYSVATQDLEGKHFMGEFNASINGHFKVGQLQSGIRLIRQRSDFYAENRFVNRHDPWVTASTGKQQLLTGLDQANYFMNIGRKAGKKGFFSIRLLAGFAFLKKGDQQHQFPEGRTELTYVHSITLLRSLQFKYSYINDFNKYHFIHPAWLISGNANVLNGADFSGTSQSHKWMASYRSSNLYKNQQWSINVSYAIGNHQYNNSVITNPSYTISNYAPFDRNSGFLALVTGEKFIRSLKSKFGSSFSFSGFGTTYAVNREAGFSFRGNFSLEGRWTTGFSVPFNLESKVRIGWSEGRWEQEEPNSNRQFIFNEKLKFSNGKKAFAALIWNYYVLSANNKFSGLDFFIHYKVSQVVKLSLTGNNLLNGTTIREKTVMAFSSANSAFQLVGRYALLRVDIQL